MAEAGVPIKSVNIGGMSFKTGKTQITKAVSVDESDIAAFKLSLIHISSDETNWTEFDTKIYKNFKAALEARNKLAEEAEDGIRDFAE